MRNYCHSNGTQNIDSMTHNAKHLDAPFDYNLINDDINNNFHICTIFSWIEFISFKGRPKPRFIF